MDEDRARTRWVAMLLFAGIILYLCWRMLQPFVVVILWAGALAIVFAPLQRRMVRWLRNRSLAAGVTLFLILLLFSGPLGLLGVALVNELGDLAEHGPEAIQGLIEDPEQGIWLRELVGRAGQYVDLDAYFTPEALQEWVDKLTETLVKQTVTMIGGALGILVNVVLVAFATFFLLRDGNTFVAWMTRLLPLEGDYPAKLMNRTREVVNASVYGVMAIALLQGALGGAMFAVLGIPSAVLWGVLMALLALIPVVGPSLVWGPAAIIMALTGQWVKAIILVAWGALVVGTIDNLLRPYLVGRRVKMHELLIFFSVLGGIAAFGVVGVVLGPVVAAIAISLLEVLLGEPSPVAPPPGSGRQRRVKSAT